MNTRAEELYANNHPPTAPLPAEPPSTLRTIFFGADGLRAGWSLLIFLAVFFALMSGVRVITHKFFPTFQRAGATNGDVPPLFGFIGESIPFVVALIVTWMMSKIERRPFAIYGLGDGRALPRFLGGLFWGIICLSILVLTLWKAGLLVFDGRLLFGSDVFKYGLIWLLGFLLVGLLEEFLTRGYVQYTLSRGLAGVYRWALKTPHSQALGFWTAALIFSFLFGFGHRTNPGESPLGLLSAGLVGIVFCLSLWRTGSLWWAIGFHTSWDWAQSFLYGVPDSGLMVQHHLQATHPLGKPILSGGTTGPEGSIFIVAVLALIMVIILVTLRRGSEGYASKLPAHGIDAEPTSSRLATAADM